MVSNIESDTVAEAKSMSGDIIICEDKLIRFIFVTSYSLNA
jgi:hypothetical protein